MRDITITARTTLLQSVITTLNDTRVSGLGGFYSCAEPRAPFEFRRERNTAAVAAHACTGCGPMVINIMGPICCVVLHTDTS